MKTQSAVILNNELKEIRLKIQIELQFREKNIFQWQNLDKILQF